MRILLLLGVVAWHVTSSNAVSVVSTNSSFLSRADAFSRKFCQAVAEDASGNFVCSPFSASLVLSMAAFGARCETERQLRTARALSSDDDVNKAEIKHSLTTVANSPDGKLNVASKIFIDQGLQPKESFMRMMKDIFRSKAERVDFKQAAEVSKTINDWYEADNETNERIKDATSAIYLNNYTKLVLANTVEFDGTWASKFDPTLTEPRPFYVNGKTKTDVTTMYRRGYYHIGELPALNISYIILPYTNILSMFVLLPNVATDIGEVIQNLNKITFDQNFGGSDSEVDLYLPKFKVKSIINLEEPLRKLGVTDMFTPKADFTGIVDAPPLMVDRITQKIMIHVDECGTQGVRQELVPSIVADNTTSGGEPTSAHNPDVFKVDRPFLFIIGTHSEQMYVGLVSDPKF